MYVGEHFCARDESDVHFLVSRKLKRSVLSEWRNYKRLLIVQCSSYIAWKRSRADCKFCLIYYRVSCSLQKSNCHWTERVRYWTWNFFSASFMQRWTIELNFLNFFAPLLGAVPKFKQRTCNRRGAHPCYFLLFVLHAEICVSRCEGCTSFGLFLSLDRPCSYLLSLPDRYIFFVFFFFLFCWILTNVLFSWTRLRVPPESSFWIEQRASNGVD